MSVHSRSCIPAAATTNKVLPADDSRLVELAVDLLGQGLGVRFRAKGRSMHPTIRDGEPITVEPAVADSLQRGDIALCRIGTRLVAHRVVRVLSRNGAPLVLVLRGDASRAGGEMFEARQVLGRVVAVERNSRTIALRSRRAGLIHALRSTVIALAEWRPYVSSILFVVSVLLVL